MSWSTRPQHQRRCPTVVAAIVLLAAACLHADEEAFTRLHDGRSGQVIRLVRRDAAATQAIRVRIEDGGELSVVRKGKWEAVSLNELKRLAADVVARDHAQQQARGESGYEEYEGGKVSRLVVGLQAHRDVPWLNVRWLMGVLSGVQISKLELKVGDLAFMVLLPLDAAHGRRSPKIQATVVVQARGGVRTEWGDLEIRTPDRAVFQVGGRGEILFELDDVEEYLDEAKSAALKAGKGPLRASTLKVSHRTPVQKVADLLELLDAAEIRTIDLLNTSAPPSRRDLGRSVLRYPDPWG